MPKTDIATKCSLAKKSPNKGMRFNPEFLDHFLPAICNLRAAGCTEADIGLLLGFAGKDARKWLDNLKRNHPEVKQAWEDGSRLMNMVAVAALFREALGYDWDEVVEEFKYVERTNPETGEIEVKEVPLGKKIKHRRKYGDPMLLKFLVVNRLPEYFQDTRKYEIDKKELKLDAKTDLTKEEIRGWAGILRKALTETDPIDAEIVENND